MVRRRYQRNEEKPKRKKIEGDAQKKIRVLEKKNESKHLSGSKSKDAKLRDANENEKSNEW
jgi:hypothetical protein